MKVTYFLFISPVFSILTMHTLYQTILDPIYVNNIKVYIHPGGPLNLLHSYVCKERRILYNKRLYSPGLKINFTLTRYGNMSAFTRHPLEDTENTLKRGNTGISRYLTKYYKAIKTMYNVVNEEVSIQTCQDRSLYKFLTQNLGKEESYKLLAIMLLLAEGIELPVKFVRKTIKVNTIEKIPGISINVKVLMCELETKAKYLIETEMYGVVPTKSIDEEGNFCTSKKLYRFENVVSLIQFFIDYGGEKSKKKLDSFKLSFDDTPSFLIRHYIFEFIHTLHDIKEFFKIVGELLIYIRNEGSGESWKRFFKNNKKHIHEYMPDYNAAIENDELLLNTEFPFTFHGQIPSNMMVNGYNREKRRKTNIDALRFDDFCDITIYTLFSCLLYDPIARKHKIDHMTSNNYKPSYDLKGFFLYAYISPSRHTFYKMHQKWTCVVQDLVLSEGELMGKQATENNTIKYCKNACGVSVKLKSNILNVLTVIAKVSGMPKEKMVELGEITRMVQDDETSDDDIKSSIEKYSTKIFNEISVMKVEVKINEMHILYENEQICIYGKVIVEFRPYQDIYQLETAHVVQYDFMPEHVSAKVISENAAAEVYRLSILEDLVKKCETIEVSQEKMTANGFSGEKTEQTLQEMVKKVEQAEDDIGRYLAINKLLNKQKLVTVDEKLCFIDLFSPYLDKMTKESINNKEQAVNNVVFDYNNMPSQTPKERYSTGVDLMKSSRQLKPNDPLIQLISNIIGSVPLNDETTQYSFVQILSSCNEKHNSLFPNIQGDVQIVPVFTKACKQDIISVPFFLDFLKYNVPNMLNRLYSKLREKYKDEFYENILQQHYLSCELYVLIAKRCLDLNYFPGIKAIKNDFKITKGMMELGPTAPERFTKWLEIVVETGYCEGVKEICYTWNHISMVNDDKFCLSLYAYVSITAKVKWNALSREHIKKICINEMYTMALLEMCLFCASDGLVLGIIYEMLASHVITIPFRSVLKCIENVINNYRKFLAYTEAYILSWGVSPPIIAQHPVGSGLCVSCLRNLNYFVNLVKRFSKLDDDSISDSDRILAIIDDDVRDLITTNFRNVEKLIIEERLEY
ncbi:hypothetical protein PAEPH01_0710 [Pancytospora epiphaga]|nr:hypothetical protein PAEPH01_0710 [Pancytospora epiphaga]